VIFNDRAIKEDAGKITNLISNGTFYIRETAWDSERIEKLDSQDEETWSKGLLEIIYQIRCNTFHGAKSFTDNQKRILIPCIKIVERINGMVIDKIKSPTTE
jgi:nickel-dependent lactate racemase